MNANDSDAIDFKPFFDLVVGILFILLILIASQLFFTRFEAAPSPAEEAARAAEARRIAKRQSVDSMLDRTAQALRDAGFTPTIDRLRPGITVPARELLDPGEAAGRYGAALLTGISCDSAHTADTRPACLGPSLARIEYVGFRLETPATPAGATPGEQARLTALQLSARLFAAAPALLGAVSSSGAPATDTRVTIETTAQPPAQARFIVDFEASVSDTRQPAR